ncbi:hypothetical protein JW948_03180 [bacterium]|nr:hypothetical protein [bacterium]
MRRFPLFLAAASRIRNFRVPFYLTRIAAFLTADIVPVTLHFDPPVANFSQVFLAASISNWNAGEPAFEMTDAYRHVVYILTDHKKFRGIR